MQNYKMDVRRSTGYGKVTTRSITRVPCEALLIEQLKCTLAKSDTFLSVKITKDNINDNN